MGFQELLGCEHILIVGGRCTPSPRAQKPLGSEPSQALFYVSFTCLFICFFSHVLYNQLANVRKYVSDFYEPF